MHRQMADVMKSMSRGKGGGMLAGLGNMLGLGEGGGKMPSLEEMKKLAAKMPPKELEQLARRMGIDPASMPRGRAPNSWTHASKLPTLPV